ncbi:dihydroneopterin aldolase [Falsirhodobacter halotolerans]|uniref:dihydroneopterin aldolase n=1 Tax=Falsirhodobacter halotolerans TaxID=1146892 RepID=UPI001FD42DCA|nr:dihydroneopterin aldolase [Falsirhodobacter halotolerans]MCJ8140246.1 dihydroneopterin aldolase [Falsirhodobacter halotolerans]
MPHDRIFLRDHTVEVEIGAFEVERGITQRLRFNVEVEVARVEAGDDVDRILSYDRIAEAISGELSAGRVALLETLADGIAARVLAHPQALSAQIEIEKPDRGPFTLGIRILRRRGEVAAPHMSRAVPVVWLGRAEGLLPGAVHCLHAEGPRLTDPEKQRRADLLALDMAAWHRADADPRFTVAGSRTEIEWAVGQGQAVLWAPARMVLDAADPPSTTPVALAEWLAGELGAASITVFDTFPAESRIPQTRP